MNFASRAMITKIHVLKSKLGLSDEHYRDMLSAYNVDTSTCLSFDNAINFIRILESKCNGTGITTSRQPARGMISNAQIGLVRGLWSQVSVQLTPAEKHAALDRFISNKFGISKLQWVPAETVQKIVRTLIAMGAKKQNG